MRRDARSERNELQQRSCSAAAASGFVRLVRARTADGDGDDDGDGKVETLGDADTEFG